MVFGDTVGDILDQHGLAGSGRSNDQPALALADGSHDVHDPHGIVVRLPLKLDAFLGVQRGKVGKKGFVPGLFRRIKVDAVHLEQGEVTLAFLGGAHRTFNGIAGAEIKPADLGRRDIDVVGTGKVIVVGRPQKTKAIGQHLKHAAAPVLAVFLGLTASGLQNGEDQFLLAHGAVFFNPVILGELGQLGDFHQFKFR